MGYWLLIALLAPTLWAVTNHIDKYLLNQQLDQRGIGALLTASALIGLPCMLAIVLLRPGVLHISLFHSLMMVANGVLYIVGLLPYLYALQRDETSIIVPLFQTTAIFSYLLGLIFLDEQLSIRQLAAVLLLVGGAVIISLERKWQLVQFKADVFWLMLLAALLNALNWFVFKYVAIQDDFWATSFWEYAGFLLTALFILMAELMLRSGVSDSYYDGMTRLIRRVPGFIEWRVNAALQHFYGELKFLEADLIKIATGDAIALRWAVTRLDKLEVQVAAMDLPDRFADRWYTLREHLAAARERLLKLRAR